MNHTSARYYQESGTITFAGTLLTLGFGITAASVLGIIYAFLDFYNPCLYISCIGTVFYGCLTGGAMAMGASLGKIRNGMYTRFLAVIVGCFAVYICWVWYLWAAQLGIPELFRTFGIYQTEILFQPARMAEVIEVIARNGVWRISSFTPTGPILFLIWLIEAGIIIGCTVFVVSIEDAPFCEGCNEWSEAEHVVELENTDHNTLCRDLEGERYQRLSELRTDHFDVKSHLRATFYSCPKCDESNFLSVDHMTVTLDSDGDEQTNETQVIKHLRIPVSLIEQMKSEDETSA